jgi:hypothetical protein
MLQGVASFLEFVHLKKADPKIAPGEERAGVVVGHGLVNRRRLRIAPCSEIHPGRHGMGLLAIGNGSLAERVSAGAGGDAEAASGRDENEKRPHPDSAHLLLISLEAIQTE